MAAVEVSDLVVRRGSALALNELTCTVETGSVTGLLGPSGSGKTTLLRALVGAQRITAGTLRVLGRPAGSPGLRSEIGYTTQAASVYRDLTAAQNVRYHAAVQHASTSDCTDALDAVGLTGDADQLVGAMSGGQANRVSLACALVGRPSLLVLDEPTVGLDPLLRRDLWELFRRRASEGVTLLVSSHVMEEAMRCDELLLLRAGRLIAKDSPAALLASTGADGMDEAFLRLVEAGATS